jgi:hypothetical protein
MRKKLILQAVCLASLIYGGLALFSPEAVHAQACCASPSDPSACGSNPNWYCCLFQDDQCSPPGYPGFCYLTDCPEG